MLGSHSGRVVARGNGFSHVLSLRPCMGLPSTSSHQAIKPQKTPKPGLLTIPKLTDILWPCIGMPHMPMEVHDTSRAAFWPLWSGSHPVSARLFRGSASVTYACSKASRLVVWWMKSEDWEIALTVQWGEIPNRTESGSTKPTGDANVRLLYSEGLSKYPPKICRRMSSTMARVHPSATWLKDQFSQTVARTKLVPCIGGSECWELGLQRDSRKLLQQVRFLFPSQVSVFLLENNEDSVSQWGNPMIWRRQVEPNPGCGSKFQYKIHYFGQG